MNGNGEIPPKEYLSGVDLLLAGDAATWAESDASVAKILSNESPTMDQVRSFKSLIINRFPSKILEAPPAVSFDSELAELKQSKDESLLSYYKRVVAIFTSVGARDRPTGESGGKLFILESSMLDTVIRAFVRGLYDIEIRKEATKGLALSGRSLRGIYSLAEEAHRAHLELKKLYDEEPRARELSFYKDLAQKNLSINSIRRDTPSV